ncbi:histone deacetylase 4-like [Callorhinchus milii]|uniref:histone deacetylase 4-like n=1 Tax=Callorhinchus milii TaxID=7868 RepID=UPI001C3FE631|nr:histone deacetylase 4-like [Callorhinchus milii]
MKLRQLWHKEKDKQSAVASSEVKQRLQEFVLKKQAALKHSPGNGPSNAAAGYSPTPLVPGETLLPQSGVPVSYPQLAATHSDPQEDFPLRKTGQ